MLFLHTRHKILLLSLLLLLAMFVMWFVWANSVDRLPQGGILVMQTGTPDAQRLVHPYYYIVARRVMV